MKTISIILAIYNKADFLRATLDSLYFQEGTGQAFQTEFVLVDDASGDDSLAIAEEFFREHAAALQIIRNEKNAGPSVRLNQGLRAAIGDLVFVFDADDIAPRNVLHRMLAGMDGARLDYVYGRSQKTSLAAADAALQLLPSPDGMLISADPLRFTLKQGIVLPIVLARRELALRAGGCDDTVFVQDESLALRLALAGHRMGLIPHPCRYVLLTEAERQSGAPSAQHLSANVAQQHHDQYLTYTHLLDRAPLSAIQQRWLARKAISPWWKSVRRSGFHPFVLLCYLLSKLWPRQILWLMRTHLDQYFAALPNVRRVV
ncbi:MAG: glycosyltransferase family 2 protein [Moraxellaceae bacterium]